MEKAERAKKAWKNLTKILNERAELRLSLQEALTMSNCIKAVDSAIDDYEDALKHRFKVKEFNNELPCETESGQVGSLPDGKAPNASKTGKTRKRGKTRNKSKSTNSSDSRK